MKNLLIKSITFIKDFFNKNIKLKIIENFNFKIKCLDII